MKTTEHFNENRQHTLGNRCTFTGKGLHTGVDVTMTLLPASADFGVRFKRIDLEGAPEVRAVADKVLDTSRSTMIGEGAARVQTIEHLLAALVAEGVDNCLIELNAQEVPIMDGSALAFIESIRGVGVIEQMADKKWYHIDEPLHVRDEKSDTELWIYPNEHYELTALVDFSATHFGARYASYKQGLRFYEDVAPARTFCFLHEIEPMLQQNLIKGGDLDNALVLVDKNVSAETQAHLRKLLHKKEDIKIPLGGYLNDTPLRVQDEPARHKLLDLVGDLALVGYGFKGRVWAVKPGHKNNVALAQKIRTWIKEKALKKQNIPHYSPDEPVLFNVQEMERMLPHRHPFLLVDKIIRMSKEDIVGVKNITYSEYFFRGHFPDNPIMPGVLQIEALAQTGGILALSLQEDPYNYDTYFLKINNCKFKQKIVPGDTMVLHMALLEPIRRGICSMRGRVFVAGKLCAEADLVAQIIKSRSA